MTQQEFLTYLFSYCDQGYLELRAFPSKHRVFFPVEDESKIQNFCKRHEKENVFFAVSLRNGKDGTKRGITQIPAVHCDLDFKDTPPDKATRLIKEFHLPPTLITHSGGGLHLYWRLKEPYTISDIPVIEKTNRLIAKYFGGDLNACDASRLLRLPGTYNCKPAYGAPLLVFCVSSTDHDYDVDAFEFLSDKIQNIDTVTTIQNTLDINFNEGNRDSSLFHVANCLAKGHMAEENIMEVIKILACSCNPPFSEEEAERKVKSALSRRGTVTKSLAHDIRLWVESCEGSFHGSEIDRELKLVTPDEMQNRTRVLSRLCDEGIIERVGGRRGYYKYADKKCEPIDYKNARASPIYFRWPLPTLESMVEIFEGNICLISGAPNAGKTAFMLDFTKRNMDKFKIHYFSSEMSAIEMRKRLLMFEDVELEDWKFFPKERVSDFEDVIVPDEINIIDFLELHDNFWMVGSMLKSIHDKLRKGVALVALQKNPGAPIGLGGYRGMDKPRLYMTLDPDYPGGIATVVKAKNWATTINPNNYSCRFKLVNGCRFMEDEVGWFLNLK